MFERFKARRCFETMSETFYLMANRGVSVYTLERQAKKIEHELDINPVFKECRHEFRSEVIAIKELPNTILNSYFKEA